MDSHLREVGLSDARARDLVDAVMGYTGKGYAHSVQEELGVYIASVYTSVIIRYTLPMMVLVSCQSHACMPILYTRSERANELTPYIYTCI